MTYAMFGDEERIFGYQGLKINLKFNASDMRPCLQILYKKKFKPVGETEPMDIKAALEDFLPKRKISLKAQFKKSTKASLAAFEKSSVFDTAIADPVLASWAPPGELWQTFDVSGSKYEVWHSSLAELAVQQMIKRMQILIPLFIDGGSLLNFEPDELDRWSVFFLYQKSANESIARYTFMGYCTVFRYFHYQPDRKYVFKDGEKQIMANLDYSLPTSAADVAPSNFTCRSRISQFIVLPPFQHGGNGSRFYNSIFDYLHQNPCTIEITVEDPNEAFDDMRDLNDLIRLRKSPDFVNIRINTKVTTKAKEPIPKDIIDLEKLEKIRIEAKIAPRQFYRVTEMHQLSLIPTNIRQSLILERPIASLPDLKVRKHEYYLWQLWVKQRLYRHNKDLLLQISRSERIEKVEQALGGVEADYARLLRTLESRQNGTSNGKSLSPTEEEGAKAEEDGEPAAKKIKFT